MGRRTLLTQRMHDSIIDAIGRGHTKADAARLVGIHPATITRWEARGADDLERHPNPNTHTMAELRAIAATQGIDPAVEVEGRMTRAKLAKALHLDSPFARFAEAMTYARVKGIDYAIREMQRAGADDWRMWAHFLAVQEPEKWSRRAQDEAVAALRPDEAPPSSAPDPGRLLEHGDAIVIAMDQRR